MIAQFLCWKRFIILNFQALAVCLSITGVVLFAYADGFGSFEAIGIVLAALFSLVAAFFRVS